MLLFLIIAANRRAIDAQSNDNLPHYKLLQIREILPQFLQSIGLDQDREGSWNFIIIAIFQSEEGRKNFVGCGDRTRDLALHFLILCKVAPQSSDELYDLFDTC